MLVYTHTITPRVQYIFRLLLKEMMGIEPHFTQDVEVFESASLPKLAYGKQRLQNGLYIEAVELLFETGVRKVPVDVFTYDGLPAFFQGNGDIPFDIFAASFFLISRYEEYLPSAKDQYQRYKAKNSLAYQHGFLDKPVINFWVEALKKLISTRYPAIQTKEQQFSATVTFDIDVAFAFRGRSFLRKLLSSGKELLSFNFHDFVKRLKVYASNATDPFDSYSYILASLSEIDARHIFFFLVAGKLSRYDRNLSPSSGAMSSLVKEIRASSEVGIHPSYYTSEKKELLAKEKQKLEVLLSRPVTISRQHYLRFQLPGTFMQLLEAGITEDYSMGYAELPGFRAGICTPFRFYNLSEETATQLVIHPVTYMEGSFLEDMGMQPDECITTIAQLVETVKAVKGSFVCIWHNHTLSDYKIYKGWRKPYEATLRLLKEKE
jgi:hypothetical protein